MRRQKQCTWKHPLQLERDFEKTLSTEEEEIPKIEDEDILTECSQEIDLQIQDMGVDRDMTAIVLEDEISQPGVIDHDHKMIFGHPHSLNTLLVNEKLALQTQKCVRKSRDLSQKSLM